MPVYNEEACIARVAHEWLIHLRKTIYTFKLCIINDGSTDNTVQILKDIASKNCELKLIDKVNSGHGQACLLGYRVALQHSAKWVLQIDSDGQCDPKFFTEFWTRREQFPVIYGFRSKREDGLLRYYISRVVSLVTWLGAGVWVPDANVPYRLMRADCLQEVVTQVPASIYLANIMLSALQQKLQGIHWINISFRQRLGGVASVKVYCFAKQGWRLLKELRRAKLVKNYLGRCLIA